MADKLNVLLVCSHNAARSQMAEALLKSIANDRFNIYSAGIEPNESIHPLTRKVIEELGLSVDGQQPKGVETYLGRTPIHFMIILSSLASKYTPSVWPGVLSRYIWPFADPTTIVANEDETLEAFRMVRDQIKAKMEEFASYDISELSVGARALAEENQM